MKPALGALAIACTLAACSAPPAVNANASAGMLPDADAAHWQPLVLAHPDALRPPAPPALADPVVATQLAELHDWDLRRTADDRRAIAYWNGSTPADRWSEIAHDQFAVAGFSAPRTARAMALVHAAIYDATIAAWDAKAAYGRATPAALDPTLHPLLVSSTFAAYPSEHAAIAYAAATVLGSLYPAQRDRLLVEAWGAAETRVAGAGNLRLDIDAGRDLGQAVAARVLARGAADGSDALAQLPLAVKPGQWTTDYPVDPLAGSWRPWLLADVSAYQLPDPPLPGTPAFQAELTDVAATLKAATPAQTASAKAWQAQTAALLWNEQARALVTAHALSTPHAARVLAYVQAAVADATICSWATQYRVLRPRPSMVDTSLAPTLLLPSSPAYPAPTAVTAAAAAAYLGGAFPDAAADLTATAAAAALAGYYGGVHYRRDGEDGATLGQRVGAAALARARADGTP